MKIPKSFKEITKKIFYDKDINLYQKITSEDSEGGFIETLSDEFIPFKGNLQFSNKEKIQNDYGISIDAEIVITSDFKCEENQIIEYLDNKYEIIKVIPRDSHFVIFANSK
ncbi:MAG: hypothetical protein IJO32_00625 [Bacilli bacterium]|nr:hypothetical protein [Bacilli bacterium]